MPACPLCHNRDTAFYHREKRATGLAEKRHYYRCQRCLLIFVAPHFHLSPEAEKTVYDRHNNQADDAGYRRFLNRLFEPVRQRCNKGDRGLDFGSGPDSPLAAMFTESGCPCTEYDIYYRPDNTRLTQSYNFIVMSEVIEHLAAPGSLVEQLVAMLSTNGLLGIMTKRPTTLEAFSNWHYLHDPTHIAFFSEQTFAWIADHYQLSLEIVGSDVVILRKKA